MAAEVDPVLVAAGRLRGHGRHGGLGSDVGHHLESFAFDISRLWHPDEAEEKVLAKVLGRGHFQEDVHEDLESGEVDFLKNAWVSF